MYKKEFLTKWSVSVLLTCVSDAFRWQAVLFKYIPFFRPYLLYILWIIFSLILDIFCVYTNVRDFYQFSNLAVGVIVHFWILNFFHLRHDFASPERSVRFWNLDVCEIDEHKIFLHVRIKYVRNKWVYPT